MPGLVDGWATGKQVWAHKSQQVVSVLSYLSLIAGILFSGYQLPSQVCPA